MDHIIKTSSPVYVKPPTGEFLESNPYRLTPYVADFEIWLHAEGNGCGDDMMLPDIEDMTQNEAWKAICEYDISAMRSDADEIDDAGYLAVAERLRGWCDRADRVQRGSEVNVETTAALIDELSENGYDEEADAINFIFEVWSNEEDSAIYRTDTGVYFLLSNGMPTFFDNVSAVLKQVEG